MPQTAPQICLSTYIGNIGDLTTGLPQEEDVLYLDCGKNDIRGQGRWHLRCSDGAACSSPPSPLVADGVVPEPQPAIQVRPFLVGPDSARALNMLSLLTAQVELCKDLENESLQLCLLHTTPPALSPTCSRKIFTPAAAPKLPKIPPTPPTLSRRVDWSKETLTIATPPTQ